MELSNTQAVMILFLPRMNPKASQVDKVMDIKK